MTSYSVPVVESGRGNMVRFVLMCQTAYLPGGGVARIFAYDDTRAAIGWDPILG